MANHLHHRKVFGGSSHSKSLYSVHRRCIESRTRCSYEFACLATMRTSPRVMVTEATVSTPLPSPGTQWESLPTLWQIEVSWGQVHMLAGLQKYLTSLGSGRGADHRYQIKTLAQQHAPSHGVEWHLRANNSRAYCFDLRPSDAMQGAYMFSAAKLGSHL